jgi:zinc protease
VATAPWPVTGAPGDPVDIEVGAEQSRLYLGRIADLAPADRPSVELLAAILSERLGRSVREELGIAYSIGAGASFRASPDRAWLSVSMGTRPDNLDRALEAIRATMRGLVNDMADDEEIDTIRAERRGRALMRRMAAVNRARLIGLRAWTGVGSSEDVDVLDAVDRVTRDDLARMAEDWLDPERFRVVIAR